MAPRSLPVGEVVLLGAYLTCKDSLYGVLGCSICVGFFRFSIHRIIRISFLTEVEELSC